MIKIFDKGINFIIKSFYFVCGLFPFGMASVFGIICLFGLLWRSNPVVIYNIPSIETMKSMPIENLPFAIAVCIALFAIFVFVYKIIGKYILKTDKKTHIKISIVLFAIVFVLSSIYIFAFGNNVVPFSEYSHSWLAAQGDAYHLERYSNFFSWSIFVAYVKFLISIFGTNYFVILILNAVYRGIAAALVYAVVFKIFKKPNTAILAALVYGFMPSSVIHAFTGGPEILSTVFGLLFILSALYLYEAKAKFDIIKYSAFMGLAIVIAHFFKRPHLYISIGGALIAFVIFKVKNARDEKRKINIKHGLISVLVTILCIVIPLAGVTAFAQEYLNIKYTDSSSPEKKPGMFAGFDINGHGQLIVSQYVSLHGQLLNEGYTSQEIDDILWAKLIDEWKNANLSDVAYWAITRNIWAWQDDLRPNYFFQKSLENYSVPESKAGLYNFAIDYLPAISQVYYVCMLMFAALICFVSIKRKNNFAIFLIALCVFGYAFGLFFSEAQSHYKSVIIPYLCMLGAFGFEWLINATPKTIKFKKIDKK